MTASAAKPANRPATRKLSILLVGTQMALGGAQRLLLDQARWFHAHGHRVAAAFLYDKEGLGPEWQRDLEFPLRTLSGIGSSTNPLKRAGGLVSGLFRLWNMLRDTKFDVVEAFTYDSNLLSLPMAWLAGVPVRIATHHGIIEGSPRLIERLHTGLVNSGMASILVNVSRKVLEQAAAAGIRRDRMTVIPNGIPAGSARTQSAHAARSELGVGTDDILIVSVGRLMYQKGHEYLIQAMQQVIPEWSQAKAVIFGEGPLRAQLVTLIDRLGLRGSVQLAGNRTDIGRFLASADIFVLPSRWEGLPVALLEAMDSGLPVVATRVEGVEEVIRNESEGLLVPPEDARALAESLRRLLPDPALRKAMGAGGRARMRDSYTIDIMCDKYLALMENLLQRRSEN